MILRVLAFLGFALLASMPTHAAMAQGCGTNNPNCIVPTRPAGDNTNAAASTAFVSSNAVPRASNNAQLNALPSTAASAIVRLGYATLGDSPPATYTPSTTCPYNGGVADGGSCVATSDGQFWVLVYGQQQDVRIWGVKGDGVTNNTTQGNYAIADATDLFWPPGTYKGNFVATNKSNFTFEGAGWQTSIVPYSTSLDALDVNGGNFSHYKNFLLNGPGTAVGSTSGIVLSSTTSNTIVDNVISEYFSNYGVYCAGTVGSSISGDQFVNGYALYNGTANIYFTYCQDYTLSNDQIGGSNGSNWGLHMVHTSAGHTTNNKIWNNGIDVEYDNSQYDYFLGNRVTQAQKQGFICNTCSFITHTENQYYANSAAGAGTYADAQLLTTTLSTFANDKFYDWNAVNSTNYNLTADSNSFNDVMTGETFSYYTTQPTNIDSAVWTSWNARSNVPSGSAYTNNDQVSALVSVVTSSVGGTGSTPYYFGAQGTNSATETSTSGFINQSPVVLHCFRIQTTVTPTGGGTYTWTVRNNDAGTSMTLTQTAGVYVVGSCFSQANSVSVAVGNPIDVQLVSAAGGGTAPATGANITISAGN